MNTTGLSSIFQSCDYRCCENKMRRIFRIAYAYGTDQRRHADIAFSTVLPFVLNKRNVFHHYSPFEDQFTKIPSSVYIWWITQNWLRTCNYTSFTNFPRCNSTVMISILITVKIFVTSKGIGTYSTFLDQCNYVLCIHKDK